MPSEEENFTFKEFEEEPVDPNRSQVPALIDPQNYFVLIDKRNENLFVVQMVALVSAFLTLLLGIIDLFLWMGKKKD